MKNNLFWALLLVLISGLFLRLYDLGAESLWFDEIESVALASGDLPSLFCNMHLSPLYFFLLRYWMKLFGCSEFALRFLSVIFSAGSIVLVYKIGKTLFNRRIGIISSLLIALSPFHLFYAQEVRNYALFTLLSSLSILFFLNIVQKDDSATNKVYVCYALATVMLLYTHLWGALIVLVQNFYFFLRRIQEKKRWISTQAIILTICLFWLIPYIIYSLRESEYIAAALSWIPRMSFFSSFIEAFKTFSYGGLNYGGYAYDVGPKNIGVSFGLFYFLGIFFVLGSITKRKGEYQQIYFLLIWLFMPIAILSVFSVVFFRIFVMRYIISCSIPYYILTAKGIDKIRARWGQIAVLISILVLFYPALTFYYQKDLKVRWNAVFDYLQNNERKVDLTLIGRSDQVTMLDYLEIRDKARCSEFKSQLRQDLGIKIFNGEFVYYYGGWGKTIGIRNVAGLERMVKQGMIKKGDKILLILSRWIDSTEDPEKIKGYLSSFLRLVEEKHFSGISVYYYYPQI